MDSELRKAIDCAKYGSSLSQGDYYTLIKWAKVSGVDGREAADAIRSARDNNRLNNIRRDMSEENTYAR
jgi:hypothetical protein